MRALIGLTATAAVLMLSACADGGSGAAPGAAPAHAPRAATPTVVAWVDRPAPASVPPAATPTTAPPPRPPTDAPPCRASQLTASTGDVGAAAGTANLRVEFTDHGPTACLLRGFPRLAGVAADGTVTVLHVRHGSLLGVAPWPTADIEPGERAAVDLSSADGCLAAQRNGFRPVFSRLRIGLPSGGTVTVADRGFDTVCGVEASRFGVPALAAPPGPPPSPLTVSMTAPATAHAGEWVDYTVTVRNPTDTAYRLVPCPAYDEYIALGTGALVQHSYYLGCDSVHAVPAHGAVTYAMRLHLPADFPGTGPAKFGWMLHGPPGAAAAVVLRLTH